MEKSTPHNIRPEQVGSLCRALYGDVSGSLTDLGLPSRGRSAGMFGLTAALLTENAREISEDVSAMVADDIKLGRLAEWIAGHFEHVDACKWEGDLGVQPSYVAESVMRGDDGPTAYARRLVAVATEAIGQGLRYRSGIWLREHSLA